MEKRTLLESVGLVAQSLANTLEDLNAFEEEHGNEGIPYAGNHYAAVLDALLGILREAYGEFVADCIWQVVMGNGVSVAQAIDYVYEQGWMD